VCCNTCNEFFRSCIALRYVASRKANISIQIVLQISGVGLEKVWATLLKGARRL
jgi:hypothetical protein